jgi:DNA-binding transcriptional regulator GbsR (MarR family)
VIKNDYMKYILNLFDTMPNKCNMIHSMILETIEYLRRENVRKLATYVISTHKDFFEKNKDYFSRFLTKFDPNYKEPLELENQQDDSNPYEPLGELQARQLEREIDSKQEEIYFNKDNEEEYNQLAYQRRKSSEEEEDHIGGFP